MSSTENWANLYEGEFSCGDTERRVRSESSVSNGLQEALDIVGGIADGDNRWVVDADDSLIKCPKA